MSDLIEKRLAARYIPKDSTPVTREGTTAVVYVQRREGRLYAIGYRHNTKNHAFNFRFKDDAQLDRYVNEFLDGEVARLADREQRKDAKRAAQKSFRTFASYAHARRTRARQHRQKETAPRFSPWGRFGSSTDCRPSKHNYCAPDGARFQPLTRPHPPVEDRATLQACSQASRQTAPVAQRTERQTFESGRCGFDSRPARIPRYRPSSSVRPAVPLARQPCRGRVV